MQKVRLADATADRAQRTERAIARFRDKPFDWSKAATCIHLARTQAAAFGHSVPVVPRFRSPLGAKRALAETGYETLEALLDATLPRIEVARMIVGDLAMLPGESFNAVVVYAGGSKVLGWHGSDMTRLQAISVTNADFIAAWAVGR